MRMSQDARKNKIRNFLAIDSSAEQGGRVMNAEENKQRIRISIAATLMFEIVR
jgi:hypothetical protein